MNPSSNNIFEFYNQLWEIRDRRLDTWFLMNSIIPTLTLCTIFIIFVTMIGPYLMKNRQPFKLTGTIRAYNIVQVIKTLENGYFCLNFAKSFVSDW